ncbi:hypothetical protein SULAZ_0390 [Sulfurihydrogenibium azorense Az-Fu1]|jgi:hypothetical protein|uniref:DUF4325 domain-containing protein n=1 Tax=Sulfurihydrogenibium azorense (strain DSM 15241 / OCM 825 / Az-Fu1) TaxID=204536 RepID=C1DTE6_SULAA|nr:STAS-like domain-containing protein [Sulfurihydrogenibium azorense]ACN98218.1 hypothetical protein SULAZ_0390 [Sulfurihydrogenibium azorense Az-Fu1]
MVVIKVKEIFNQDMLGSRENGLILRQKVEEELSRSSIVVIDFEGIDLTTQGFVDEFIGVLIREKGLDFVREHIKIKNASDFVKLIIQLVISYSKKAA